MRVVDTDKKGIDTEGSPDGLSRRAVLMTATIAAGVAGGAPSVLAAESSTAASFGAPLVEMYFPIGVLSLDQKAALIKSVTDVVNAAMQSPPDPARRLFVEIIETPEGGFGVNGQVVGPRAR